MAIKNFLPKAYFQGDFVDFEKAQISVATHSLQYGIGAFGGLRGTPDPEENNQSLLFRLDRHAKRLSQSAKYLNYDLSADFIKQKIIEFVKQNKFNKPFYIRPFIYTSALDIAPRLHEIDKDFLIYGLEMGDYLSIDGVKVCFSSYLRNPDSSIPSRGKISGGYINSALAKTEAYIRGFDEAILLNTRGMIAEASAMNVFIVKEGIIYTPGTEEDILEGITRMSVIQIARDFGYQVIEKSISQRELIVADEVFLTGTAAKLTSVNQIENYNLPQDKPIAKRIKEILDTIVLAKDLKYKNWITKIKF